MPGVTGALPASSNSQSNRLSCYRSKEHVQTDQSNSCDESASNAVAGASDAHSYLLLSEESDDEILSTLDEQQAAAEEKCKFCPKSFLSRKERVNHEKVCDKFYILPKKPSSESSSADSTSNSKKNTVQCQFCGKGFGQKKNCNRHEKSCQLNSNAGPSFTCELCGLVSNRKDNFSAHEKKCQEKHNSRKDPSSTSSEAAGLESLSDQSKPDKNYFTQQKTSKFKRVQKTKTPCMHSDCDQEFFHKTSLIEHLKNDHGDEVKDCISKQFDSLQDFQTWKNEEEELTFSYFSQKSGQSASKMKYFYCQHDGVSHSLRKTGRQNAKGRIKVGHYCIAKIQVWMDSDKKINVLYYPTHSHLCNPQDFVHQPLAENLNFQITEKLLHGVSPSKIYKEVMAKNIPKTFSKKEVKNCKAAVLTKKRIRERARKIKEKRRYHKDEAKALGMMVHRLATEDDCVLVYKPFLHKVINGPKDIDNLPKSDELFLLGIQTNRQRELLAEHCHKIVLVDETHSTNHHGYQLLSVMVIDDNRRGWPVGHLITSKSDADTLQYFFKAMKEKLPTDVKINCVISDDDPALINSMEMGFGQILLHILCKWHLLKNFKKNLNKYVHNSLVESMMTELRVMVNEQDEVTFLKLQEGFIKKYEENPKCKKFIHEYYIKYYQTRPRKWAMCHRKFPHANINTTGHIESFHHRLKSSYLKRKVNRRLDDLVTILLDIEWDDHLRRIQEETVGMAFQPQEIVARHLRGMNIKDEDVTELDSDNWDVKPSKGKPSCG